MTVQNKMLELGNSKVFPYIYSIFLCSHLTVQFDVLWNPRVSTAKNRVEALSDPASVEGNDSNISENQREMISISR